MRMGEPMGRSQEGHAVACSHALADASMIFCFRCVCCSLRKDIVKAFAEIERRSKGREKPIDAIIMETTGLADPAPVAFTFFANPWVASRFKLDSIM